MRRDGSSSLHPSRGGEVEEDKTGQGKIGQDGEEWRGGGVDGKQECVMLSLSFTVSKRCRDRGRG